MAVDPVLRAEREATAAWSRYQSTVTAGGTPEQRDFAFASAMKREEELSNIQKALDRPAAEAA